MHVFDYEQALNHLADRRILSLVSAIREERGHQDIYLSTKPEQLDALVEVARVQSTGASNAIENIRTTNARLQELMERKVAPRNRDEREILGYRHVLDLIHESYEGISITPGVILQLHRELYRYQDASFAGRWKDSDNVIAERDTEGRLRSRFVPTSARATPEAMERLCRAYQGAQADPGNDPLLLACLFVFDFTCIHPFVDGNGRMSRLLTLLLLYKGGYLVGKYVSIEAAIEKTKSSYYAALAESSQGWHESRQDYEPIVAYLLGVILSCYRDLDERVEILGSPSSCQKVAAVLSRSLEPVSKRDLMEQLPSLSQRTVERALSKLQKEGKVGKVGAARATRYVWVR